MPRNLEFKARVAELKSLEAAFISNGAVFSGSLEQCDTYFRISDGRLKLREAKGKRAELIFYKRDESSSAKMESIYSVLPVRDASLRDFLSQTLGVKAVVAKTRRLLILENARIHLDDVKGLGTFIEFEVVTSERRTKSRDEKSDRDLLERLKECAGPFVLEEIRESYSDLIARH